MKSTITQLKKLAFLGVLVGGLFTSSTLKAQTPCSGTTSWGCGGSILGTGNPTESPGDILDVEVKNAKGTTLASYTGLGCTSSSGANAYRGILNSGKGFDVTASETITVTVTGGTWASQGWGSRCGIWIDAKNGDQLWMVRIKCPEALTINLAFNQTEIPAGNELYVYNPD